MKHTEMVTDMSSQIVTIKDLVETPIRAVFEKIMLEEIDMITAEMHKRVDIFSQEQKKKAKHTAQKMALDLMQKANMDGLSIEFKI